MTETKKLLPKSLQSHGKNLAQSAKTGKSWPALKREKNCPCKTEMQCQKYLLVYVDG